ncbi:MAG: hypothetical protein KatS3mg028_1698 [Bacteroidia bacterium]|nr:MAG: hypothetical protein KatS3mg028_1698 [Bacteroidia bacterium]
MKKLICILIVAWILLSVFSCTHQDCVGAVDVTIDQLRHQSSYYHKSMVRVDGEVIFFVNFFGVRIYILKSSGGSILPVLASSGNVSITTGDNLTVCGKFRECLNINGSFKVYFMQEVDRTYANDEVLF